MSRRLPALTSAVNLGRWFAAECSALPERHAAGEDIAADVGWLAAVGPEVLQSIEAAGRLREIGPDLAAEVTGHCRGLLASLTALREGR